MRTKVLRVEQKDYDEDEVNTRLNETISSLEGAGSKIRDVRIAVGRDADASAGLEMKYSVTFVILYD